MYFSVIICDRARPILGGQYKAQDYLDGEEVQCEIVQMIGDVEDARDIGPVDVMIVGRREILQWVYNGFTMVLHWF